MKIKKLLSFILVIVALFSLSVSAFAEEPNPNISQTAVTPRWTQIDEVDADISADGSTLYYFAFVYAKSENAKISGTMYLQKYGSGRWTTVDSCGISDTGSASIEESYVGSEGTEYRTKVVVTVAGESATAYSDSITLSE